MDNVRRRDRTRASNIELLRIVAMLMIVVCHIVTHCVIVQLTDADSIARMGNGVFNHPVFYRRLLVLAGITPLGPVGNAVFVLISGYFLVPRERVGLAGTSRKLLLQQGFAAALLVVASTVLYLVGRHDPNSYVGTIGIASFNYMSWFVGYYFLVILVAHLFLNRYLAGLDARRYGGFLLVLFAFTQFAWAGGIVDKLASGLRTLLMGVFFYALGGYIRKYDFLGKVRTWVLWLVLAVTYGFVFLSSYNQTVLDIEKFARAPQGDFLQSVVIYDNWGIVPVLLGVCLFVLFTRLPKRTNRLVNYVAGATLMVYLFHDNKLFYSIWNTQDWITLLSASPVLFVVKLALWALGTFTVGVLVYCLFRVFMRLVERSKRLIIKTDTGGGVLLGPGLIHWGEWASDCL